MNEKNRCRGNFNLVLVFFLLDFNNIFNEKNSEFKIEFVVIDKNYLKYKLFVQHKILQNKMK